MTRREGACPCWSFAAYSNSASLLRRPSQKPLPYPLPRRLPSLALRAGMGAATDEPGVENEALETTAGESPKTGAPPLKTEDACSVCLRELRRPTGTGDRSSSGARERSGVCPGIARELNHLR